LAYFIEGMEKILNRIVVITFFITFLTVMVQIISRFIPSMIVPWTEEITRLSFMYTICFGAPLGIRHLEFAKVDSFIENFPQKTKCLSYCIIEVLIFVFCVVFAYTGMEMIQLGLKQVSIYLGWPMYIVYSAIPVCFFLCCIMTIDKFVAYLREYKEAGQV